MISLVIDASVAIKWVVPEPGTEAANALRRHRLYAPDLLIAECANILWKKVRRANLTEAQALAGARLLERADIELVSMRPALARAAGLAMMLGHPAYDCLYLVLAETIGCDFVTADDRLHAKARSYGQSARVVRLTDAISELGLAARR